MGSWRRTFAVAAIMSLALTFFVSTAAVAGPAKNFRANLSGLNQVPVPVDTRATGQAIFQLSKDGTQLRYKLIVANIDDVFMAHIHFAPSDMNGPVVVWLYPDAPPPLPIAGRFDGVLAEGVIEADDLVGPLEGASIADLVNEILVGNTYVNVHTNAFPAGEIRGQLR